MKITLDQATRGIAKMADVPDLREVFHVSHWQFVSARLIHKERIECNMNGDAAQSSDQCHLIIVVWIQ